MRDMAATDGGPPDPGSAGTLDGLVRQLRQLKAWAGHPSYELITDRLKARWTAAGRPATELPGRSTVADCFRPGRRRLSTDLVLGVVEVLTADPAYAARWRHALRVIGDGEAAARQVRVFDALPDPAPRFVGRSPELRRIRDHLRSGSGAVVISGMPGVGKTWLAVQAGHLIAGRQRLDRVFVVNLRGFSTGPDQPSADPAAVLGAFLQMLGVPAHALPSALPARADAFRRRVADGRTLVVLDNAADEEQVRPLIAAVPGCLTLVTSRRDLVGLRDVARLRVDVFSAEVARRMLAAAAGDTPVGADPAALARIADSCGYLPLALGAAADDLRRRAGWTLTDHAHRLDKRRAALRLESSVETALDVSYRRLAAADQRLLRLLVLLSGQDFDAYAAAALLDAEPVAARRQLDRLRDAHLLQAVPADRYRFHELVRVYARGRAEEEEPLSAQRAALTRLRAYAQEIEIFMVVPV